MLLLLIKRFIANIYNIKLGNFLFAWALPVLVIIKILRGYDFSWVWVLAPFAIFLFYVVLGIFVVLIYGFCKFITLCFEHDGDKK